jgi:hypothetical protein
VLLVHETYERSVSWFTLEWGVVSNATRVGRGGLSSQRIPNRRVPEAPCSAHEL